MKKIFLLALVTWSFACTPTNTAVQRVEGTHFGETISDKGAITYDKMLVELDKKGGLENVKVEGQVEAVCQAKGCWMTIVSDDAAKEKMMVKFKDYGFFMPLDLSGKTVVMRGNAYKEETSVDELRHLAEDAGKSKEEIAKITEPKVELKFLADGVVIKDSSK